MTKTDRILGYLPSTFRPQPERSPLYAVVDAFGSELLAAENSLAAVMRSHWVDLADKGETSFAELARIAGSYGLVPDLVAFAALYGLAPREDEDVEEFREHLKRYVRTFLEGTVTVQGILRITAEALALRIADDEDDLDAWWERPGELLTTTTRRPDDAAELVFGFAAAEVRGVAATAASVEGTADLGDPVDLQASPNLSVAVDGGGAVTVDLAAAAADPAAVTGVEIRDTLVAEVPGLRARFTGGRLTLASGTTGAGSQLAVGEGPGDAASAVLGLAPRSYQGRDPAGAEVQGEVTLAGTLDLTDARYLRLRIDGTHHAEVDCAAGAADPAAVTLAEVVAAVNDQLGIGAASAAADRLVLSSPTTGSGSVIHLQEAAAQDARIRLLGDVDRFHLGRDAAPARVEGTRDLGPGADLSASSTLRLSIDGGPAVDVDVAGAEPAATTPAEIVLAINTALGAAVADHDGRFVTLASPTAGPAGSVEVGEVDGDAAPLVLGLAPRRYTGSAPTTARLEGTADLSGGADLRARHVIGVAVGARDVEVDARAAAADPAAVGPGDVADAINAALGAAVASSDGQHVALTSPVAGQGGRVRVAPLLHRRTRRYVTRAAVTDDAAVTVLGVVAADARGSDGARAAIRGVADLTGGADLRTVRYLRLGIDGAPPQDVDCAGARPRATTAAEAVEAINTALGAEVAFTDGRTVDLVSPTSGAGSRIELEPARATDALPGLLGVAPGTYRGTAATAVVFTGIPDLAAGVDLPADAAVKLAVDDKPLTEVVVGDAAPATRSLSQIGVAINVAFAAQVAGSDGTRLLLGSLTTGAGSRLQFAAPAGPDATADIFGIAPPRAYQGAAAGPARVVGPVLAVPLDLSVARTLRIGVDGAPVTPVDTAAAAADPAAATLAEIVDAVNDALGAPIASDDGGRLALTSPSTGLSSRITLEASTGADARQALLGAAPDAATGSGATPAVITGKVDLTAPVDLSEHPRLRLVVDGGLARDVDVSGASPGQTFAEEIVAALDAAVPGVADLDEGGHLRLTSPTAGAASSMAVEPRRHLEVQEYPPEPAGVEVTVRHGTVVATGNGGAAATPFEFQVTTPSGVVGPRLVSLGNGWSLRVHGHFRPGTTVTVARDADGETLAWASTAGKAPVAVDPADIEVREHAPGAGEAVLQLPRGRSRFMYLECTADRFAAAGDTAGARFGAARFAGPPCREVGVFDGSVFADAGVDTIFAPGPPSPAVSLSLRWEEHRPGSFVVNLPVELAPRFGGRFNQARFGGKQPEQFPGAVFEPPADPDHLAGRLDAESGLVVADIVDRAPIGYEVAAVPFRSPQRLTLGNADRPARLYLSEEGLAGVLRVSARSPGEWGNGIALTARASAPARYDVEVLFPGARFENARQVVAGPELPELAADLLAPGPVGVLAAKGGGVRARVERDRA